MNTAQIDKLNVLVLMVTGIISFIFPFEVFLFSFIVLGPLHYLTEISWLGDRGFFLTDQRGFTWLAGLCGLAIVCMGMFHFDQGACILISAGMIAAWLFTFGAAMPRKYMIASVVLILCSALSFLPWFVVVIAVLVPTVIHTLLFTVFFMLSGAIRFRSRWGFAAVGVLICIVIALALPYAPEYSYTGAYTRRVITGIPGLVSLLSITHFMRFGTIAGQDLFTGGGLVVGRLISFTYAYHYLNWFSKTTVIRWHEVPRRRIAGILAFWAFAVLLYCRDIEAGIRILFYLALLHTFLEFPLNVITIKNVLAAGGSRLKAATCKSKSLKSL